MISINKIILIIIISTLPFKLSSSEHIDLGDPTIQAICKVTLLNNETYEGIITIANGGYFGIWTNGFCFENEQGFRPLMFSLDLRNIERIDQHKFEVNFREGGASFSKICQLHFMEWEFSPSIKNPKSIKIDGNTLTWNTNLSKKYNLLESIDLYQSLPKSTYISISSNEKLEIITIQLSDIKRFELIENPSIKWQEEIKKKTEQANQINNGPGSSGDFMPAFWYHEIITNEMNYDYYQSRINETINK